MNIEIKKLFKYADGVVSNYFKSYTKIYKKLGFDIDDLEQEGHIVVWEIVEKYKDHSQQELRKLISQAVAWRMINIKRAFKDGTISKTEFLRICSNGKVILDELINKKFLENISPAKVRLIVNLDLIEEDVQIIAKNDFDKIWAVLQRSNKNKDPFVDFINYTEDSENEVSDDELLSEMSIRKNLPIYPNFIVEDIKAICTDEEWDLLQKRVFEERTYEEIGKLYGGLSKGRIHQRFKLLKKKIVRSIPNLYNILKGNEL